MNRTVPANGGKAVSPDQLWVVVEGLRPEDEAVSRKLAAKANVGAVIVARVKIDQSYAPRMISTK